MRTVGRRVANCARNRDAAMMLLHLGTLSCTLAKDRFVLLRMCVSASVLAYAGPQPCAPRRVDSVVSAEVRSGQGAHSTLNR